MFKFISRTNFLNLSKDDQDISILLKDKNTMSLISQFIFTYFILIPLVTVFILLLTSKYTLSNMSFFIIFTVAYCISVKYVFKRFYIPIKKFKDILAASLYSFRYVLKGNAISKDDFDIIKKENKILYQVIIMIQSNNYCYDVCFEILKSLKKGTIQFIAIKQPELEKNNNDNEYSMHVLYVNNTWCYDTYSERQWPLEEVMKVFKSIGCINYTSFAYADVYGKSYEKFREEHITALAAWCKSNDCYQEW